MAALFSPLGHIGRAQALLVVAGAAALLVVVGVDLRTPMSRLVDVVVRTVTDMTSWGVGVLVVLPAWAGDAGMSSRPLLREVAARYLVDDRGGGRR